MSKKILRGAILESALLSLIQDATDKGVYGYSILKTVKKKFGICLGPSTLYSQLRQLEKNGLITSNWDLTFGKARRQYRITRKGEQQIKEYYAEIKIVIPAFVNANLKMITSFSN
jgi:DNA-binding PadR family transcriptional regulator